MGCESFFLEWGNDLIGSVISELTRDWKGGNIDLRDHLVVVPTRSAARRLRERLAEYATARDAAVIPGLVVTPEFFIEDRHNRFLPASESVVLATWVKVLEKLDLRDYPALFPRPDSTTVNRQWTLDMADKLLTVKRELAEAGLALDDAAEKLSDTPESDRWQELAILEREYRKKLSALEVDDPDIVKQRLVKDPRLPEYIKKISVFAVPDPVELAVTALQTLGGEMPVSFYVYAPHQFEEAFDEVGRPRSEFWENNEIDIPDFQENIVLTANPAMQAKCAADLLADTQTPADSVVAGVPDPEVTPHLEYELREAGIRTFDPAGEPLSDYPLITIVGYLKDVVIEDDYNACLELLRHPDVLDYAAHFFDSFNSCAYLQVLDKFHNEHLPGSFRDFKILLANQMDRANNTDNWSEALHHLKYIVEMLDECCQNLRSESTAAVSSILSFLQEIYRSRELSFQSHGDKEFIDAAEQVTQCARELQTEKMAGLNVDVETSLTIFLRLLRRKRVFPERPIPSVDLPGWLELLWDDSPSLILTGMNDGRVPETMVGDVFLPDSARVQLGLRNNRQRFARDAYILTVLIESRSNDGEVTILCGKTAEQNEPLKPSRLLFLCDDDEMVRRAEHLFSDISESKSGGGNTGNWRFSLPDADIPAKFGITALNSFLQCPFRFYLKHVLGMEPLDDRKLELDALDFGNIIHKTLEILHSEDLQHSTNPVLLGKELEKALDRQVRNQYGSNLTAPVMVQLESARQRLHAAVEEQVRLIELGWRIKATEKRVKVNIAGVELLGRIDRIDEAVDGKLRILDYKTSEKQKIPRDTIWGTPVKSQEDGAVLRDYMLVSTPDNKEKQWTDLQLPLYKYILQQEFPDSEIECGYFNLPRAVTETGVTIWEEDGLNDDKYIEAAVQCARSIIEDIKEKRFWPPARGMYYDDFGKLFLEPPSRTFNKS